MSKMIDLTGEKFGMLKVIKRVENSPKTESGYSETQWLCECDCGNQIVLRRGSFLYKGKTNCGCVKKAMTTKHGMSHTRIYGIWIGIKQRCFNKCNASYKNYGSRGISVCDEWLGKNGFKIFYDWSMKNGYSDELTIDRIDVNGNYEPSNCRWVSNKEQSKNKRNTLYVTFKGETLTLSDFCKKYNINYHTAYNRYSSGYTTEEILKIPKHKRSGSKRKVVKDVCGV